MIYSNFDKSGDCIRYPDGIQKALDFLRHTDISKLDLGEYPIDGKLVYVKIFMLKTLPAAEVQPEAHEEYMDIHFAPEGDEMFGFAGDASNYNKVKEDKSNDIAFYDGVTDERYVHLKAGDFVMVFPGEIHSPGVMKDGSEEHRKVVIKVHKSTF